VAGGGHEALASRRVPAHHRPGAVAWRDLGLEGLAGTEREVIPKRAEVCEGEGVRFRVVLEALPLDQYDRVRADRLEGRVDRRCALIEPVVVA
jgi:hypothetical protein